MSVPTPQTAILGSGFHPLRPPDSGRAKIVLFAILVTLFFHLGLFLSLPDKILRAGTASPRPASFEILLEERADEAPPPPEPRFVEANPEVPENPPDESNQYSFRDQQAADQSELPVVDNEPDTGGEEDSQKIVESPPFPVEAVPPPAGVIAADVGDGRDALTEPAQVEIIAAEVAAPTRARSDAFPFDDPVEAGSGVRLEPGSETVESEEIVDAAIPLTREAAASAAPPAQSSEAARPQPRPRPRLAPDLVEAPLRTSQGGAPRRGEIAVDATFSAFGEYQQQMIVAVQRGWFQEIEFFQPLDSAVSVHIRFVLQADGVVRDLRVVDSSASELAAFLCQAAIEKRSPFRPWTREMVDVFGEQQTLNFRFFYR